jgi:hypothetical protein
MQRESIIDGFTAFVEQRSLELLKMNGSGTTHQDESASEDWVDNWKIWETEVIAEANKLLSEADGTYPTLRAELHAIAIRIGKSYIAPQVENKAAD